MVPPGRPTLEAFRKAMVHRRAFWRLLLKPIAEEMGYEAVGYNAWRDSEGQLYDRQGRVLS